MRMSTRALAAVILATLFGGALAVDKGGMPTAEGRKKQLCPWAERCVYVDERGKPLKRPICTKFCPRDCAACSND